MFEGKYLFTRCGERKGKKGMGMGRMGGEGKRVERREEAVVVG